MVDERVRQRLRDTTRFGDIRECERVDSTNRWLLDAAAAGAAEGLVAVADHQVSGRGRLGRVWEAPPGSALLMSVLLRPAGLPVDRFHLRTAAVGLAARQACREVAGFTPGLKWPNDLLVGPAKLAGILAEARDGAVVVGVGCNVAGAPPGAISAETAAGRPVDRGALLGALLAALERWYGRLGEVPAAYRAACATIGQVVRVSLPAGDLIGLAEGVDDDGRLLVRPPRWPVRAISAGDVVHLRPAPFSLGGLSPAAGEDHAVGES